MNKSNTSRAYNKSIHKKKRNFINLNRSVEISLTYSTKPKLNDKKKNQLIKERWYKEKNGN